MNEKLTTEQRVREIVDDEGMRTIEEQVEELLALINPLTAHPAEDEPKLITDEMEADILGMFHRETPKEMHGWRS